MDAEAGVPFQPPLDPWGFVGAVIIDDQMNVQERQKFPVVPIQELDELLMAVALHALADPTWGAI